MANVLVTGGCVRLGKAIGDVFAAAGWRVVRSSHRVDAGADIVVDLSLAGGADELMSRARSLLGGLPDVLVNNAALYVGVADDESIWQVNYRSARRLAELMTDGIVVNILDKYAEARHPGTAYAKSKKALSEWGESKGCLAYEAGDISDLAPLGCHEKALEERSDRLTSGQVAARIFDMVKEHAVFGAGA